MYKSSIIYLLANVINAAVPFVLLPFLTEGLSPVEYGQVAIFQTFVTGLAAFVGISVPGLAATLYNELKSCYFNKNLFLKTCLLTIFVSMVFVLLICTVFIKHLSGFLSLNEKFVFMAIFVAGSNALIQLRLTEWQMKGLIIKYALFQVLNALFTGVLSYLLVCVFYLGVEGRVFGQAFVVGVFAVFSIITLTNISNEKINIRTLLSRSNTYIKRIVYFGVPLIPHIFGVFLLSCIDRFFINHQFGLKEAGIYMVMVQFASVLRVVFDAFNKALTPWLFNKLDQKSHQVNTRIVKVTYLYAIATILMSPFIYFILLSVMKVMVPDDYYTNMNMFGLKFLILGQVFTGIYLFISNYLFYQEKTMSLAKATFLSAIIHIILLYPLVVHCGVVGATFAYSLSMLIRLIFVWYVNVKVNSMPWFFFIKR